MAGYRIYGEVKVKDDSQVSDVVPYAKTGTQEKEQRWEGSGQ